ncbi:unnamed protein product, partial [Tetraodon nigroviridis]
HEHHELVRQRHLRAHRVRGVSPGSLQQALHQHVQVDPDGREAAAARGAGQARRVRGHQGRDQVHQLQVDARAASCTQRLFSEPPPPLLSKSPPSLAF